MVLEGPSWTAIACSRSRALHMRLDRPPWIYEDKIAADLVDLDQQIADGYDLEVPMQPLIRASRGVFLVRERFCEDALADGVRNGATQYVVLGAGLNGFAFNGSKLADQVRIFEIDHPSTQEWKKTRLREIGIDIPENLTFVPIDFEHDTLSERLLENGIDRQSPIVFAWTGVTQYLPDEAINETLDEILRVSCSGSVLSVQITLPKHLVDDENKKALDYFMSISAERGETWVNAHDPAEFSTRLERMGFVAVEVFGPTDAADRYLRDREDGLTVSDHFSMLKANVG